MEIGYARVSTRDQDLALQSKVFADCCFVLDYVMLLPRARLGRNECRHFPNDGVNEIKGVAVSLSLCTLRISPSSKGGDDD
jgi:hypothetical protein